MLCIIACSKLIFFSTMFNCRYKENRSQSKEETLPDLCLEPTTNKKPFEISGRRIINIDFFIKELQALNHHSSLGCGLSEMVIVSERRLGFKCCLQFKCKMCNFKKGVWTEDPEDQSKNINSDVVIGMISIGSGFWNMEELFSTLDIPPLSTNTYTKEHQKVSQAWEIVAEKEMEKAAENEKRIAVQRGEMEPDGTPLLTVVADGSWAKRSYRTNYSSLSGVVSIKY